MEQHINIIKQLIKDYNFDTSEKNQMTDLLKEQIARHMLDDLDLDPHWEEQQFLPKNSNVEKLWEDICDITIAYHYAVEDIIDLDRKILELL